jgi:alanyl-tRNA synthetase
MDAGYWVQGDGIAGEYTRKCGASTELFFDRGAGLRCSSACQPGCRCGRFIEIANVLFINSQIDQLTQSLRPLSTPFTETVIGAERVAMSLQEKLSVFDIEDIAPLVRLVKSYGQVTGSPSNLNGTKSEHVIADHIRALLLLAADGAPEPNKKRGRSRIVRTLIRRIRTYQQVLGITEAQFIPDLLNTALNTYTGQHLDLDKGRERAWAYYRMENKRFDRTLSRGFRCFDRLLQQGENGTFGGKQALYLVKRKGFPLPLIKMTLAQRGIKFDELAYWSEYAKWERDPRRYWEEHEQSVRP